MNAPLSSAELDTMNAYWRAANYLAVGQIYLLSNPLLREPLRPEHIKPRLLGHWGTTPGLNFVYLHMNRVIKERGLDAIFVTGPGHGGPALVANAYLEGSLGSAPRVRHEHRVVVPGKRSSFAPPIPSNPSGGSPAAKATLAKPSPSSSRTRSTRTLRISWSSESALDRCRHSWSQTTARASSPT